MRYALVVLMTLWCASGSHTVRAEVQEMTMRDVVCEIAGFHAALAARDFKKVEQSLQVEHALFRDFVGMEFGKLELGSDLRQAFVAGDAKQRKAAIASILSVLKNRSQDQLKAAVEDVLTEPDVVLALFTFCSQSVRRGPKGRAMEYVDAMGKLLECTIDGEKKMQADNPAKEEELLKGLLFVVLPCLSDEVKKTVHRSAFTIAGVEGMTKKDLVPILRNIRDAYQYLYLHPVGRQLYLDQAAKDARVSSTEFRKKKPWGADEGPNRKKGVKRSTM